MWRFCFVRVPEGFLLRKHHGTCMQRERFGKKTQKRLLYTLCATFLGITQVVTQARPANVRDGGCTLVMPVCRRLEFLSESLEHYSQLAQTGLRVQLIVVVQPCYDFVVTPLPNFTLRADVDIVYKHMRTNDMNNRYLDFPEIQYECVVNIDDDVLVPLSALLLNINIWRKNFRDYYVGWHEQTRSHLFDGTKVMYANSKETSGLSSLLLPTGSVFHRRYLSVYNSKVFQKGRMMVTTLHNCDDILMNFVLAVNRKCPVIVHYPGVMWRDARRRASSATVGVAQFMSPTHVIKRHACLTKFTTWYGNLKYSLSQYEHNSSIPTDVVKSDMVGRKHIIQFSETLPKVNTLRCGLNTGSREWKSNCYFHTTGTSTFVLDS